MDNTHETQTAFQEACRRQIDGFDYGKEKGRAFRINRETNGVQYESFSNESWCWKCKVLHWYDAGQEVPGEKTCNAPVSCAEDLCYALCKNLSKAFILVGEHSSNKALCK